MRLPSTTSETMGVTTHCGRRARTHASVPLPWWTSKSTIATRLIAGRPGPRACRITERAKAAPIATLFKRQNPLEPSGSLTFVTLPAGPAWWPGGRVAQKTLRLSPSHTRRTASHTAPAACIAASNDAALTVVSGSSEPRVSPSSELQSASIFRTYAYS